MCKSRHNPSLPLPSAGCYRPVYFIPGRAHHPLTPTQPPFTRSHFLSSSARSTLLLLHVHHDAARQLQPTSRRQGRHPRPSRPRRGLRLRWPTLHRGVKVSLILILDSSLDCCMVCAQTLM